MENSKSQIFDLRIMQPDKHGQELESILKIRPMVKSRDYPISHFLTYCIVGHSTCSRFRTILTIPILNSPHDRPLMILNFSPRLCSCRYCIRSYRTIGRLGGYFSNICGKDNTKINLNRQNYSNNILLNLRVMN